MVLNYIWSGFFLIALVVGAIKLVFFGDTEVFTAMVGSTFEMAKVAFEISLGLTGVLTLWLGLMRVGEKGGVINLLSGYREELTPHLAAHRAVDGLLVAGPPDAALSAAAADSVKRVRFAEFAPRQWNRIETLCSLHMVQPFVETKTLWHPVAP